MSTTSPQAAAAGSQALWQAQLAQQLSGVAQPELQSLMGRLGGMLTTDEAGRPLSDAALRSSALSTLNQGYDQAIRGTGESISYGGLRSGEGRMSPGAFSSGIGQAAVGLERDRAAALRNLEFASAQASMADYNKILSLMGQGVSTSLGLASGFSGAANAAIGGLSNQTQAGGILGGAASGAALGSTIYPGWGTVIGAGVGALAGGLTSP